MFKRIEPSPDQESVWDYPRPPRVEAVAEPIKIMVNGLTIVESQKAFRVLETSHPPTYYIPQDDIKMAYLKPNTRYTLCEFKGQASYWDLIIGDRNIPNVAWGYLNPNLAYAEIAGYLAFYASLVDEAYVGEEKVQPQPGDFYGGWITSKVVGPFKGGLDTNGW